MSQVRNANITFEIERDQREKPTLLCGIEIFPLPIILVEIGLIIIHFPQVLTY